MSASPTSTPPDAPPVAPPTPRAEAARHAAERWAEAVKAQSIYPAGHHRVGAALDQLLGAILATRDAAPASEAALQIVFADGGLLAAGTQFPVDPDGPLAWLRERLDHGALAGVEIEADVGREALESLGRRLLDVFATKDPDRNPQALFAGHWPGLRLLDRRFEGVFDAEAAQKAQRTWGGLGPPLDASARARLTTALHDDPGIRERLAVIRQRLGSKAVGRGGEDTDELLHHLTSVLPAAVAEDRRRVRAVAGGLLDALEQRLEDGQPGDALLAFFEDPTLSRRVAFLYSSIFREQERRGSSPSSPKAEAARPQGHSGDERVDDDLAAFLFEYGRLPSRLELAVEDQQLESRAEELGVLLHVLASHEGADTWPGLRAALARALADPGEAEARVVGRVLASLTQRADGTADRDVAARVVRALVAEGHLALLRRSGHLAPGRIAGSFPQDFLLYLDVLDLSNAADRAELGDVLQRIGLPRLSAAEPALATAEALFAPQRLPRVLAQADVALAPLVDVWFRRGGPEARRQVLDWLRHLPGLGRDATLFALVDDPEALPDEYLRLVFDRLLGRRMAGASDSLISALLVRFVESTVGRVDRRARRIQALRLLATSRERYVEAFLGRVAYGRRWLVFYAEEKPVRLAAREALAQVGAA